VQTELAEQVHLSVVAASRNDNHGGYLTQRMQHFVDGFVAQCQRHAIRAELILVEWNPPPDRRPLAEELKWPEDCGPCDIRIITVPREVHEQILHGDKLPLFQMIAKNVGIRRARGRFVLATNIDILFSDEVMRFIRDRLREGHVYRADRFDVPTNVPVSADFSDVLHYCRREAFRVHATGFTLRKIDGRWVPRSPIAAIIGLFFRGVVRAAVIVGRGVFTHGSTALACLASIAALAAKAAYRRMVHSMRRILGLGAITSADLEYEGFIEQIVENFRQGRRFFQRGGLFVVHGIRATLQLWSWVYHALIRRELFTNACGDFTLLSAEDWSALRGYPEWAMYSWHLDSILLYQSNRIGLKEIYLGKSAPIYHIEHEPGSGFTPESSGQLFERLQLRGIPYLDWTKDVEPLIAEMDRNKAAGKPIQYNAAHWGYASSHFRDVRVDRRPNSTGKPRAQSLESYSVSRAISA
jgi:hypothetical protein